MDQKINNNDVIPSISTNPSENATRPEHTEMTAASPTPADIAAPSNESSGALNVVPAVAGEADAAAAVTNEGTITTVPETSPMSPSGASRDASDERTSEQVELAISAAIPTENSSDLNVTGMTSTTEAANNASSPVVTDGANEATHSVATAASPESPSGASSEHTSDNPELWIPDAAPTRNPEKLTSNTITATVSEATSTAGSSSSEEANTVASVASPESTLGASTDVARTLMSDDPALWTPNVASAGNPATHTNVTSRPEEPSAPATAPVPNETVHPATNSAKETAGGEPSPEAPSSSATATAGARDQSLKPRSRSTTETAENLKTVLEGICDMVAQSPNSDPKLSQYLKIFRQKFYSFINSLMPNHAIDTAVAPSQTTDRVDNKEERKRLAQEAYICWCRSVQDRVAGLSERLAERTMKVGVAEEFAIELPDVADLGCVFKPLTNNRKINVTISTESNKTKLCISGTPSDHLPTPSVPLLEICFEPDSDRLLKDYEVIRSIRPQPRSGFLEQVSALWTLTIRPDPRLMWRSIPFDEGSIYYKPDADSDWCEAPDGFRVLAGSQKGRSHWHVGSARDDDFAVDYRNGWNFLAVADGAGSRQFSRQGSKLACQFAADRIFSLITPELEAQAQAFVRAPNDTNAYVTFKRSIYGTLVQTIFDAKTLIEKEANQSNHKPGDFATTMLCALVKKFDEGWCIASFMVGDGAMALYDTRHGVRVLGDPDEGEYGGQTVFITMSEVWEDPNKLMNRVRVTAEPDFTALFLMTDGVSDPKFETTNQLANKDRWKALYDELRPEILSEPNAPKAAERLACEWLTFYSEGNHDDRTLVVMHRPEKK